MEKEFVPYVLAVKLKELGFDEPCFGFYSKIYGLMMVKTSGSSSLYKDAGECLSPTYSQAFRWFREKYHIIGEVKFKGGKTTKTAWYDYVIYSEIDWNDENPSKQWKTYEEAELACLEKLIEIVELKSE
jgi:hypothetical protein